MAIAKALCSALALLVIICISMLGNQKVSAQCEASLPGLQAKCGKFVAVSGSKVAPSKGCCQVVKAVDAQCVCNVISKDPTVSIEKAVYVARTCGVTIKAGEKCGSYTVSPLA